MSKRTIISSSGPAVELESVVKSCYCCGVPATKRGSPRISFAKHLPYGEGERIYLCLQCAGTAASSIIELITGQVKQLR